jgi:hypothetical protein
MAACSLGFCGKFVSKPQAPPSGNVVVRHFSFGRAEAQQAHYADRHERQR